MDITPTADDKGLQRMRLEQQDKSIKPTRQIDAYPRIHESAHQELQSPLPHSERRKQERRKEERRQEEQADYPYDTRSSEERRQRTRRADDRLEDSGQAPAKHIDECV